MSTGTTAGSSTASVIGHQLNHKKRKRDMKKKQKDGGGKKRKINNDNALRLQEMLTEALENNKKWLDFISALSAHTIHSDKKLQKLLDQFHKAQEATLKQAIDILSDKFDVPGNEYKITGSPSKDKDGIKYVAHIKFTPSSREGGAKSFSAVVAYDNSWKPNVFIDEDDVALFVHEMDNDVAKNIRGSLIQINDRDLTSLDKVEKAYARLDKYMGTVQKKVEKIVNDLAPLDVKVLRTILKTMKV